MRARQTLIGLLGLVLATVAAAPALQAQLPDGDFAGLYQRWQKAQDPETTIALGEELLERTKGLASWPLETARERVNAEVWFGVASAYAVRPRGDRADNLERAIGYFDAALRVWSLESDPQEWGRAHNNAGIAHWARIRGDRPGNQERAIAHYEAALKVFTRDTAPREWAQLQNNLAIAYSSRIHGKRDANIEAALAHFDAVLAVFTRESDPLLWATAQNNVGTVYRSRTQGGRADNEEKAIGHIEAALTVFTREAVPHEWASARYNLAKTYLDRVRGTRRDNQEAALSHLEGALEVFTQESFPEQWARTQSAIGDAYADRIVGLTSGNRQLAIGAYEAALTVFTRGAFPREHMRTGRLLGRVLMQLGYWNEAGLAHTGALNAFRVLFGEGIDDADARALIADAGPLFAEAAFATAQDGEAETALTLADEGRARLLAVAMRLHSLDLPDSDRWRLDELRAAIRTAEQDTETAVATERAQSLERLAALRRELLHLIGKSDGGGGHGAAIAEARRIADGGGAAVMPIVTAQGGKLIVVTRASGGHSGMTVVDMPELTLERLSTLLVGPSGEPTSGWFGAYFVNYLDGDEQKRRWPEWLAAVDRIGPRLWRLVGMRLDAALKERGIKSGAQVVWLPSGWLGVLPLGLAQNPMNDQRLADAYEITIAPSLETLAAARRHVDTAAPPTLAAIVNPTRDLPGADKEGEIVASHFGPAARRLLFHERATPDAVLRSLRDQSHWHFASHGTFSWADVRESALVMHGPARLSIGRLLAAESLGRPRLVVLSACETGLVEITTNPDEFIGLPGTFMAIGAAGVVGTLWPVNDAATTLLMAKFYELHIDQRLAPATALARAQAWLRQATDADLIAYIEAAVQRSRISPMLAEEMTQELSPDGLRRTRNGAVVEWIKPQRGAGQGDHAAARARPYAHPYFWAGFVHTGL